MSGEISGKNENYVLFGLHSWSEFFCITKLGAECTFFPGKGKIDFKAPFNILLAIVFLKVVIMNTLKDLLKHPFVLAAIGFFVVVIGTISVLLSGSSETHIFRPGGSEPIIHRTVEEVENILEADDVTSETEVGGRGATVEDVYETSTSA